MWICGCKSWTWLSSWRISQVAARPITHWCKREWAGGPPGRCGTALPPPPIWTHIYIPPVEEDAPNQCEEESIWGWEEREISQPESAP